jgi:hypothetical protein
MYCSFCAQDESVSQHTVAAFIGFEQVFTSWFIC